MNVPLLSSVSAIALIGYVGAVIVNGNLSALVTKLESEWHFLEFLVCVGILYGLVKVDAISGPVSLLIGMAFFGLLLKISQSGTGQVFGPQFAEFAQGQMGLFDLAQITGAQVGKALGLMQPGTDNYPASNAGVGILNQ